MVDVGSERILAIDFGNLTIWQFILKYQKKMVNVGSESILVILNRFWIHLEIPKKDGRHFFLENGGS